MSQPHTHETAAAARHDGSADQGSLSERIISDPLNSVVAGIVAPTAAFGFVLSAMYGIALVS